MYIIHDIENDRKQAIHFPSDKYMIHQHSLMHLILFYPEFLFTISLEVYVCLCTHSMFKRLVKYFSNTLCQISSSH